MVHYLSIIYIYHIYHIYIYTYIYIYIYICIEIIYIYVYYICKYVYIKTPGMSLIILLLFHFISFSPQFIDYDSFLFPLVYSQSHSFHLPQNNSFMSTLFGCTHVTWSFNLIASSTFQPIQSLDISNLRVSLDKFFILNRWFIT